MKTGITRSDTQRQPENERSYSRSGIQARQTQINFKTSGINARPTNHKRRLRIRFQAAFQTTVKSSLKTTPNRFSGCPLFFQPTPKNKTQPHDFPPPHKIRPARALAEPYRRQPAVFFNTKPAAQNAENRVHARCGERVAASDGMAVFPPLRQRTVSARLGNAAI